MKKSALEIKFDKIKESLGNQGTFYSEDIASLFPDMKKSSLYWNISKLVENGYLKRIRNGVYSFNEWKGKEAVFLSDTARKIQNILDETGLEYYISGMDILAKHVLHVPETYPVLLFIQKSGEEEIERELTDQGILVIQAKGYSDIYDKSFYGGREPQALVYLTDSFVHQTRGIATTEKAFVDLYFAVTRNKYPLALQELVRIYGNMMRVGAIDQKALIRVAGSRSLQYDIRFIVESKYISDQAFQFVDILKRED